MVFSPTSSLSAIVSLRDAGKTFANGVEALHGMRLDVRRGEFLTLLGPSGCGKSTVLRMIAGLTEPSSGAIVWDGGMGGAVSARDIGFVFQEPTLMPWTTVADNVRLPLTLSGVAPAQAATKVATALARVGLADFAQAYPRELSGGMKMRVSLARALVTEPKLLLMDEPFAALDEMTRFRLNDELLELWRALRMTVVFVTHSVFESVYLSDRILVMTPRPGRIARELAVDAPRPRGTAFRASADYARLCGEVSVALYAAADAGVGA
jgi:NitT/TauT family transport system ATP-binding protein